MFVTHMFALAASVPGSYSGFGGGSPRPPKTHAEAVAYADIAAGIGILLVVIIVGAVVADRILVARSERRLIDAVLAGRRRAGPN